MGTRHTNEDCTAAVHWPARPGPRAVCGIINETGGAFPQGYSYPYDGYSYPHYVIRTLMTVIRTRITVIRTLISVT